MTTVIAREVPPEDIDFSNYFDDDGMKSCGGENCAVYIIGPRGWKDFNESEYKEIRGRVNSVLDGFDDAKSISPQSAQNEAYKEILSDAGIEYSEETLAKLKAWAKTAVTDSTSTIAAFLTIITKKTWESRGFSGYSQGDYCTVVYCSDVYDDDAITEIGKMYLGCGTEFCINDTYGYYVVDTVRWDEGDVLRNLLAEYAECGPKDLDIYLYKGEHRVADYELMT